MQVEQKLNDSIIYQINYYVICLAFKDIDKKGWFRIVLEYKKFNSIGTKCLEGESFS